MIIEISIGNFYFNNQTLIDYLYILKKQISKCLTINLHPYYSILVCCGMDATRG